MRLSVRSCPSLPLAASLLLFPLLAGSPVGCAKREPPPPWQQEDVQTLPMRPEWRRFADENYRGVVLARLNAPPNVTFVEEPRVVATRNKTRGTIELLAVGQVDVPTTTGVRYRRPYTIVWEQSGGGWEVTDARVEPSETLSPRPEEPATPAPAMPRMPTSRPATAPAEGTTAGAF